LLVKKRYLYSESLQKERKEMGAEIYDKLKDRGEIILLKTSKTEMGLIKFPESIKKVENQ
jgi:hypothetical protein